MRTGVTVPHVFEWLYEVEHVKLSYGLKYNGVELEKLSPGTKGIVLLILYLGMDVADTRPLIVDQPDENLDNESIYELLTGYFKTAKRRRQIILITHNPNLVVNADSEQVVVATAERHVRTGFHTSPTNLVPLRTTHRRIEASGNRCVGYWKAVRTPSASGNGVTRCEKGKPDMAESEWIDQALSKELPLLRDRGEGQHLEFMESYPDKRL